MVRVVILRFAALIRLLGAGFGYLDAQIVHGFVDGAARGDRRPQRKSLTSFQTMNADRKYGSHELARNAD
jgi:hypothetical protein